MPGFSIDDVRESFERDINDMLSRGRARLDPLAASPVAADRAFDFEMEHAEGLSSVFHSIHGTTALVDATGLSSTAKALEDMAEEVKTSIRVIAEETAKIRERLAAGDDGLKELARMLRLELDGSRVAANAVAADFRRRHGGAPSMRPSVPAEAMDDNVPDELKEVFESEAMTLLGEVKEVLERIEGAADKELEVGALRRVFHTLKGAAAMVGFGAVSADALAAQEKLDAMIEGGTVDVPEVRRRSRRAVRRILRHCPIPALRSAFGETFDEPSEAASDDAVRAEPSLAQPEIADELREVFLEELEEARDVLASAFGAWKRAPGSIAEPASIARKMHQLKGAAATMGMTSVVAHAADLQGRMEAVIDDAGRIDESGIGVLLRAVDAFVVSCGGRPLEVPAAPVATQNIFVYEARGVLTSALSLADGLLGATIEEAQSINHKLGRYFHRLKGSALLSGDVRVSKVAERLQRQCDAGDASALTVRTGIDELGGLLGIALVSPPERGSGSKSVPQATGDSGVAEVSIEPALWEAFEQEFRELTDGLDAVVLGLEASDDIRKDISLLLRSIHTLKGAVNTVGMSPTGLMLHAVEDMLEGLLRRETLPHPRELTKLFVFVQSDVRRQLKEARAGRVRAPLREVEGRIRRLLSTEGGSARTTGSNEHPSDSRGSGASDMMAAAHEQASIRVPTTRLDSLMNLAGELVVYRSKMASRVTHLRGLHKTLDENRRFLAEVVDDFRVKNEFSLLRQSAGPAAVAAAAFAPSAAGFTELELDKYEEINLLSRRVTELTDDVNEVSTNMEGELVALRADADALDTVIGGIQGEVTRARMVSLDVLFTRLRMPARDAADREGREVAVETAGGEVSVDKMVADALFQPLLHVVRNAVVHGIEPPASRARVGKPREGVVRMTAREDAGQVVVEIEDDGAGLALDKLRDLGVARGLLPPTMSIDDPAVKEMVFVAGISTRDKAGDVSGRGVGGDVVRRAIQRLNGRIEIETAAGKGTKFTIFLPISLAISKALLVRVGAKAFAVPLHFAERIVARDDVHFVSSAGAERVRVQDALLGLHDLHQALRLKTTDRDAGPILVLRFGEQRLAIAVDAVLAQEEIVVKELGELFVNHPLFSGVTVRGSGDLVLLLDVSALFERHFKLEGPRVATPAVRPEPAPAAAESTVASVSGPASATDGGDASVESMVVAPREIVVTSAARVLFVDDSLSVRKVAERMLEAVGADVTVALDGVDAMQKLREQNYDLVFTDLEMPHMNGFDLLREIRFLPSFHDLPVVIVSSRSGTKHQDQARSLGANDYLTKPFTEAQLKSVISRFVTKKKAGPKKP